MIRTSWELAARSRSLVGGGVLALVCGIALMVTTWLPWVPNWLWHNTSALITIFAMALVGGGLAALHRRDVHRERSTDTTVQDASVSDGGPRTLTPWFVVGIVLSILGVALFALLALLGWINRQPDVTGKDRATAQLEVAKIVSGIAVGGGGLFALYLTARKQRTTEAELRLRARAQQRTESDADRTMENEKYKRFTDEYSQAVTLLGSDSATVRLAGLFALEHLAQESPDRRQLVMDMLCTYLRMPYTVPKTPPADSPPDEQDRFVSSSQERQVRDAAQRIILTHLTPGSDGIDNPVQGFWPDIDLDLTGAVLIDFRMTNCRIRNVTFERVNFYWRTHLDGTVITGKSRFDHAKFHHSASFVNTRFQDDVRFEYAKFVGEVEFLGAKFQRNHQGKIFEADAPPMFVRFDNVTFANGAIFTRAEFRATVTLDHVKPEGAHLVFDRAKFMLGKPALVAQYGTRA